MGKQELFDAVKQGNLDSVRRCLSKCTDINGTDGDGLTPLHYAARKGKLEVTKFLVEKGANVNAETLSGSKPIHFAVDGDDQRIIEFLLNKGANVNDANNWGWTPLHWAANDGKLEITRFLVSKGADIHAIKPTRGSSSFGNFAAKVAGFMGYGDTPLDVAREKGHKEIVIYLLDEEARMLWRKGEYEKAFEAFKEVFNIQKVELGSDHPDTLSTCSNMAWMLNNQSEFKEASQVFEEVFNIQKVKLGYDHPDTLETRDNMMQMFSKQDKYERGEGLQGRARKLQEEREREERERERIRKEEARERKLEQSRRMDQWMLEKTRGMSQREIAEFKRSMATDCVIQSTHSNTRQQEAFLRGISNADVRQVKQGLYLPSFEASNEQIKSVKR